MRLRLRKFEILEDNLSLYTNEEDITSCSDSSSGQRHTPSICDDVLPIPVTSVKPSSNITIIVHSHDDVHMHGQSGNPVLYEDAILTLCEVQIYAGKT